MKYDIRCVMWAAWNIRRKAAEELNVKVSMIPMSYCLKRAWKQEKNHGYEEEEVVVDGVTLGKLITQYDCNFRFVSYLLPDLKNVSKSVEVKSMLTAREMIINEYKSNQRNDGKVLLVEALCEYATNKGYQITRTEETKGAAGIMVDIVLNDIKYRDYKLGEYDKYNRFEPVRGTYNEEAKTITLIAKNVSVIGKKHGADVITVSEGDNLEDLAKDGQSIWHKAFFRDWTK